MRQSFTYPSEKLAETIGNTITMLETMIKKVTLLNAVEQHVTATIKKQR
jgi:hypothetical protein